MKLQLFLAVCGVVLASAVSGQVAGAVAERFPDPAGKPELRPGQVLHFTFPELPETLTKKTPHVSLRLPDNYAPDRSFPLFIFLPGGAGGNGAVDQRQIEIAGTNDWVLGSFPLFGADGEGIFVGFDCYPKIKAAYEAFLQRIEETVPNVDRERSVIGGSSNGAHTLAALLSAMDATTLRHFKGFFFIDGGEDLTLASLSRFAGQWGAGKRHGYRFLFIYGGGDPAQNVWWRPHTIRRAESFKAHAAQWKLEDCEVVLYPGKEHGFHAEYHPIIAKWMGKVSKPKVESSNEKK